MKKILPIGITLVLIISGFGAVVNADDNSLIQLTGNAGNKTNFIVENAVHLRESEVQDEPKMRDWTIVSVYSIPNGASGLAFDGTYLYCGIYGVNGDEIYRIDPTTGSYVLLFSGPQEDAYGLTFDGTYLWTTDHPGTSSTPAVAYQLDFNGTLISQFNLPDHYMSGIAYDDGEFWVATYYPDPSTIYRVDSSGNILQQFTAPDNQPWDLCIENEYLWMADYWGDTLYRINKTTGSLVESHPCEIYDPAGIVFDGTYLWYCDEGVGGYDQLYKVDLYGGGTPEINVPVTSHNYGTVTVGDSVTWNAVAENIGTADLSINDVVITGSTDVSCPLTFPVVVSPGNQTNIPLIFEPQDIGPLNAIASIQSNDPLHPEVDITLTGNGVSSGPDIFVPTDTYNYGTKRIYSTSRWYLEIQNVGDDSLIVQDITSSDTHFYLDSSVSFPISVPTIGSIEIPVWFRPTGEEQYSGVLAIESNDPDENPYNVSVEGAGEDIDYPIGDLLWHYTITTGYDNSPKAIAPIQDVTDDGIDDVIVCSEDDFIRCFNGNADGLCDIIWEHEIYAGSVYSQTGLVISEDVNEDGYQEVVVGSAWGGRLIRMISGKTGSTIWTHDTHEYGGGGWVYQVDCRFDYNNDGKKDVLASTGDDSSDTGPKRIYCLDAETGDSIWECYLAGPGFSVIGVEDFTGDGIPDVVAGASDETESYGWAYGIDGDIGNIIWSFNVPGSSVWALEQLDDINGDGVKDVIIGDFYISGNGEIYGLDATNGAQLFHNTLGAQLILRFERLNDVNGDGHADFVAANSGNLVRMIDGNTGAYIWTTAVADKVFNLDRIGDVSGDGINDVVVGTLYTNNYCYFIDGVDGTQLHQIAINTPVDAIGAIPDINDDGSWEVVVGGRDGTVKCFSGGYEAFNPLDADFSADITYGQVPLIVEFTDLSNASGTTITSWKWDFDNDGEIDSEDQNPTWTYYEEGIFTVSLRISDGDFSDVEIKEDYITVTEQGGFLEIGEITGGLLKINAEIQNTGTEEVTEVNWSISLEGGFLLTSRQDSGLHGSITPGNMQIVTIDPIIGLGKIQITVTAETEYLPVTTKTVEGFVLLFFVFIR